MKKILIISGVFLMLLVGTAAAKGMSGIGLYGNLVGNGTGAGGGIGLTLKLDSFPVIGLEWNFLPHSSIFGGSVDWWIVNQPLVGIFAYYVGIGGYVAVTTVNSANTFNFGGRVPIGLQLFPIDPLEIFLEVSPMIIFVPTIDWTVSVRLGFRILI
jgi:hypothetical protein